MLKEIYHGKINPSERIPRPEPSEMIAVPDTHLANWKAADLCEDDRLDVFDLCLMKRKLFYQ